VKVVSDTSPICYLVLVGQVDLLKTLFEQISIPTAVRDELAHTGAPGAVRAWIAQPPAWLVIRTAPSDDRLGSLSRLHPGEREAILLATEMRSDLILLDDRAARRLAQERGLAVSGLLGLLSRAAREGRVSLPETLDRLRQTNFRVAPRLLKAMLEA